MLLEECKGKYRVYVHVNKINGKIYIGQTCNSLYVRSGHGSGVGYKHCAHFYNAIKKYSWDNFEHIILVDNISLEMANIIEEELISKYNSMDRNIGYNMMSGGGNKVRRQEVTDRIAEKNRHPSEETRRKMSIASKKRRTTPELVERIRQANLGKKRTVEQRKRISEGHKNPSAETRKKISEAGKGRKTSDLQKRVTSERAKGNKFRAIPITQYELDGTFIRTWECAMDVEKEWNIKHLHSGIAGCCRNKNQSAHGFMWKYYNGDNSNIEPYKESGNKRPVEQYSITGEYIGVFESILEASRISGISDTSIISSCKKEKSICGGYQWKYQKSDKIIKDLKYKYVDIFSQEKFERIQDIVDNTPLSNRDVHKCLDDNEIIYKDSKQYKIERL